jgi:polysaccharide deacetylase family protein (PEP-CTERM system associated)
MNYYFLLTIDVEDWFQVENFKKYIPFDSWPSYELRVEKNTHRLLDLLDAISVKQTLIDNQHLVTSSKQPDFSIHELKSRVQNPASRTEYLKPSNSKNLYPVKFFEKDSGAHLTGAINPTNTINTKNSPKGTFFVLGWLAERLPHLVREIHSRGHEVASHGYYHNICNEQSHEDLKTDLCDSKSLLEDIIGNQVYGYRAPSFAINNDILKIVEDCGYLYDSSYNSFSMHGRYGHLDLSRNGQKGIAIQISSIRNPKSEIRDPRSKIFYELPISNLKFAHQVFPWGGGGYFRLIPSKLFEIGIKCILRQENAYLFYFHPWEIDPKQPRVNQASSFYKFRHYINLNKTHIKLSKLIENFKHCNFITCSQYLNEVMKYAL